MGIQKTSLLQKYTENQIAKYTKKAVGKFYKNAPSSLNEEIKRCEKAIREIALKLIIPGSSVYLEPTEFGINMRVNLSTEVLKSLGLLTKVECTFPQHGTLFNFSSDKVCKITSQEDLIWV